MTNGFAALKVCAHTVEQLHKMGINKPMQTVTTSAGEFAVCKAYLAKMRGGDNLGHWPEIRALLNEYCGYMLAEDEVLLLEATTASRSWLVTVCIASVMSSGLPPV